MRVKKNEHEIRFFFSREIKAERIVSRPAQQEKLKMFFRLKKSDTR